MGELLRRRAMMQTAGGSGPSLPYMLKQGTSSRSGRSTTVSGNSVSDSNTGGSTGARPMYINGSSSSNAVFTTTWFSLNAGDVVTWKWKNIVGKNNYSSGNCRYSIELWSDSAKVFGVENTFAKGFDGTIADMTASTTLTSDVNITCVLFYAQRASAFSYDIELLVNGIRYI